MAEVRRRLGGEWGALVGPLEGAGGAVVVIDEGQDAAGEILGRGVSRLSATTCQRVAAGSVATTAWTWARKSASVRVGPAYGAMTWPATMSRLRMNERVPWRMYSNSRRSTLPGASGRPGCLRSRAWTPVNSSVLTQRSPCSESAGAS